MTAAEYKTLDDSLPSHCDDEESLDSNSQETIEDNDESSEDELHETMELDDWKILDICTQMQCYFSKKGDTDSLNHLMALQQSHRTRNKEDNTDNVAPVLH